MKPSSSNSNCSLPMCNISQLARLSDELYNAVRELNGAVIRIDDSCDPYRGCLAWVVSVETSEMGIWLEVQLLDNASTGSGLKHYELRQISVQNTSSTIH